MNKNILILLLLLPISLLSKPKKPVVLVYGNTVEGYAAAVQSAQSNLPTVWVIQEDSYFPELKISEIDLSKNGNLIAGLWSKSLLIKSSSKNSNDTIDVRNLSTINSRIWQNNLEKIVQETSNLTIIYNQDIKDLKLNKKTSTVTLSDKRKIEIISIVDATRNGELKRFLSNSQSLVEKPARISKIEDLNKDQIRTLVSLGGYDGAVYGYTLNNILARTVSNIFFVESLVQVPLDSYSVGLRFNLGQALGAMAGYVAFFKTTTDKIDVRKLQTELLAFNARFIPFLDVRNDDPHFNTLQKMYLSGIFEFDNRSTYVFSPNDYVKLSEVKPVLLQYFSRSQLWFVDNTMEFFTIKDAVELIKMSSFKGAEVEEELKKGWGKKFKFMGEFDLARHITRYEFAVLLDLYAQPFSKTVNQQGVIQR